MAIKNISQIAATPVGSKERATAVAAYVNAALIVCQREGLMAAAAAYAKVLLYTHTGSVVDMLKAADALASKERAEKNLPKTPTTPKVSADKSGYEIEQKKPDPAAAPPPPSPGFMGTIKKTLGPQGPLILAGGLGLVALILFIPKKRK